jgi:hypothetical protein
MKPLSALVFILASSALLLGQEREVPKDSSRITIDGCARGRTFIIMARPGHETRSTDLQPGRRFRLSGSKDILKNIETHERMMVQVTGLVRKADLEGPGGISTGGGRVRIGGGQPVSPTGPARNATVTTTDPVLDVEGWMQLPEPCPDR